VALLKSGGSRCWLVNQDGRYSLCEQAPEQPVTFTLEAAEEDWRQLFEAVPKPGWQTLNGMIMSGRATLHGDSLTFHQYLLALELMLGKLPSEAPPEVPARAPAIEPVTGRYLNLVHEGREHRIYFEEAGEGPALLCLHTAGADGRQYRGVLNDPEVTSRHRVIVFDLPRHGKSSFAPGAGGDAYLLTTDAYVRLVLAVADALGLDKPVVMGCSIGGRAVLHLALKHGDRFRAAIGLQSALFADPGGEDFSGTSAASIFRPDANGAEIGAAMVAGITAPDSPAADRWETLWYYMQGAPGVFLGDLYYYFVDGDLRNQLTGRPGELGCPLYLLTGEYDLSATPEMTAEVAELTGAAHFEVMRGLGHFPMSENYAVFRNYLHGVLDLIQKQS
jgi:pimeloyl-ACP methyl ester carboxylesterase